jgi:hypothetical protein
VDRARGRRIRRTLEVEPGPSLASNTNICSILWLADAHVQISRRRRGQSCSAWRLRVRESARICPHTYGVLLMPSRQATFRHSSCVRVARRRGEAAFRRRDDAR